MTRHKIRIILWSILDVGLYPVVFMITIPVFMDHMGETTFGFWMLVNAILVTGQILSMGLGTATNRNVSKYLAGKNHAEISKTINTNILSCFAITVICIVLAGIIIFGIRELNWFNIESAYQGLITNCLIICIPFLIFKFIEQILQNAIRAYENFVLASILNMISRFGMLLINFCIIYYGNSSLELMLLSNLGFILIVIFLSAFMLFRLDSHITFNFKFDLQRIKDEINFGWWIWLQSLFVIVAYQGDRFLVMSFFGPSKLAYYSIVSNMFNHIHMCFFALAPWVFPKIAKMIQNGENAPSEFFKIRRYIVIFACLSLWVFSVSNQFLLTLWLGPEKYSQIREYTNLFILFELFFVFSIVPYMYCNSGGFEKLYTRITFIFTSLNFAGMIVGYLFTGTVTGLIWGLVISTVPGMMIQNFILNQKIFKRNLFDEMIGVFIPVVFIGLSALSTGLWYQAIFFLIALLSMYKVYFPGLIYLKEGERKLQF